MVSQVTFPRRPPDSASSHGGIHRFACLALSRSPTDRSSVIRSKEQSL